MGAPRLESEPKYFGGSLSPSPRASDSVLLKDVPKGRFEVTTSGQEVFEEANALKLDDAIE